LLETDPLPLLPEAIFALARGETWVSPAAQNLAVPRENGREETLFSSKERELFPHLAQGMTS
jgi:DNA-binding NarL/FixJ family response regulator